jgi:ferric-dicitrate binding protein FerR (iron transport regulator)
MTDKELIDAFLTGELDDPGMAQLEAELRAHPELVRELADQQQIEQALKVLLGDDAADQQVTVSVLSVLRADPLDSFKKELLAEVKQEAQSRRKQEASAKVPVVVPPPPAPVEPRPVIELVPPPPRIVRRRTLPWAVAGAVAAAALLVAAGVSLFSPAAPAPAVNSHAFLLSVGPGAELHRGDKVLPARVDMALEPGDRLTINESAETRIGFADDPTRIKIKGPAKFRFIQGGIAKRVHLENGDCEIAVPPQSEAFTASTPYSILRLTSGDVRLLSAGDFARLEVRRGQASFTRLPDRKHVDVEADQYAVAGKDLDLVAKALHAAPSGEGPAVVALLKRVQGEVYLFTESAADRTPARSGMTVVATQSILTEGPRSSLVVEYPDHTLIEIAGAAVVSSLTDKKDKSRKLVTLDRGTLVADVAKQPAEKSMILRTPQAEVAVLGTRFTLTSDHEAARTSLQVEEGAVRFTRTEDRQSIEVRSGYQAVAAPNTPLAPVPLPGGVRYIDIDLGAGVTAGDGDWTVENRVVKQSRVSRLAEGGTSTILCRADADDKESLILDAVAQVEQTTPDTAIDRGTWGFGVEAMFRNRSVVLRSAQGPEGTSVFEFPGLTGIPFEHGREGRYRLKLSIERRGPEAVLRGKIWQGDLEPDGWMIENVLEIEGPLTQVGLQTMRCACTFSTFKVKSIKAQDDKPR